MTEQGTIIITQEQFDEIVLPTLAKYNQASMQPVKMADGMLMIEPLPKHRKEVREALKEAKND